MKLLTLIFISLAFIFAPIKAQDWLTNFEQAKQTASKENRNIILVFQGSDWCAPCIKLDRAVWSTDEFKAYAKDHFVMLQADFPRKKINQLPEDLQQQNNMLAEHYNQEGYFPFVVILNKDGKVLGKTGYQNISTSEYIDLLESFNQ